MAPDTEYAADLVHELGRSTLVGDRRRQALRAFATATGWQPSDVIDDYPRLTEIATGHIVVEHGLDTSAVISFLPQERLFAALHGGEQSALLAFSYNQLIDWHLFPDRGGITIVHNRGQPTQAKYVALVERNDAWLAGTFGSLADGPSTTFKGLDDALIETIARWRRFLRAELGDAVHTHHIAALFNIIIFLRTLEDQTQHARPRSARLLLDAVDATGSGGVRYALERAVHNLGMDRLMPSAEIGADLEDLRVLDTLGAGTAAQMLSEFYLNRFAPYDYDFSLMSRHALSRIYEHYVSLLREPETPQLTLVPSVPEEVNSRALGGVYTPQFIARFFGRFLLEQLPLREFRGIRVIDPACGSGIFLRTILELQAELSGQEDIRSYVGQLFDGIHGIDVDPNACHACRLSLSLLHLSLTKQLPRRLNIVNEDALEYFYQEQEARPFDVVVANPPFVKWERLSEAMQSRVVRALGDAAQGRADLFLAMLKLGMDQLRAGGYLLYVLPHSFLISESAHPLRQLIAREFWVHVLADLSGVPVFEGIGSYVVLLVAQKKPVGASASDAPPVTLVKCREFVGRALSEALARREASTPYYAVYEAPQATFSRDTWEVLSKSEAALAARLERHPPLTEFLEIRQGMNTGDDEVFIRDASDVPSAERAIYAPFLPDTCIDRYAVPQQTGKVVFMPFVSGTRVTEAQLERHCPVTWAYLRRHRTRLEERGSVRRGDLRWWSPERPRTPATLLCPKIVGPHLMLVAKFGLDSGGKYAVSRTPYLVARDGGAGDEILRYYLAVMNSPLAFVQVRSQSHRYGSGYSMLEAKTLSRVRAPSPSDVSPPVMQRIVFLVSKCMTKRGREAHEGELHSIIEQLYGG